MTDRDDTSELRAARLARGWSQSDAARELVELARSRGASVAAAPSVKTLLSRWENGHTVPEPQYRTLLAELYQRSVAELGLAERGPAADTAADLGAALAAADALGRGGLRLWRDQLDVVRRLDDELGAAGAGELTRALADRLAESLLYTVSRSTRTGLAAVLADAAALAGTQELDRGDHDQAWRRFDQARNAAGEASTGTGTAVAVAGQAAVLVDVGEHRAAAQLVEQAPETPDDRASARLDAALAMAKAAAGEQEASRQAIAAAEQRLHRPRIDMATHDGEPPVELVDLHRWRGRVLVTLDDPGAEEPLRHALDAGPRSTRHRAALHADLALSLQGRHPEDAERHARTARQLAAGIGSERIPARLAAFRSGR